MRDEADSQSLEHQLRREAQELLSRHGRQGSAAALVAEHRRRARWRRVRMTGAAATVLVVFAGAMATIARNGSDPARPPELAHSLENQPVREAHEESRAPQITEIPASRDDGESLDPIPFLLTGPDAEGRPMIAVGVYIPPRVERVNLHDLPPLEQAAVRRVLEIDEEEIKPTI